MPMRQRKKVADLTLNILLVLLASIALLLLVAPTAIVVILSFTDGYSLKFPPRGFSLRWYEKLLDNEQLLEAAWNSVRVGLLCTVFSVVLGSAAALGISRSTSHWAKMLDTFFMSPLVLPALAFGLAALMYFSTLGVPLSFSTLVIGHTVLGVPYVIRTTTAALTQLPTVLLESSASLGASKWYTLRKVTLPLIAPGIAAGAFICFMSSFDNIPVSLFLRDASTDMLPIRMWQDLENRMDVSIAAISSVMVFFTVALMVCMEKLTGISRRMR